jgi:hypothetical protein
MGQILARNDASGIDSASRHWNQTALKDVDGRNEVSECGPDGRITQLEWASSTLSPGYTESGVDELRAGHRQVSRLEILRPSGIGRVVRLSGL